MSSKILLNSEADTSEFKKLYPMLKETWRYMINELCWQDWLFKIILQYTAANESLLIIEITYKHTKYRRSAKYTNK